MSRPVKNTEHYSRILDSDGTAITIGQQAVGNSISIVTATGHNAQTNLKQVGGATITLGQKAASGAIPVVHSSDVDVSMRLAYVGNKAFSLGQAATSSSISIVAATSHNVPTDIRQINGSTLNLGPQTSNNSIPVVLANDSIVPVRSSPIGEHGNLLTNANGDIVNSNGTSLVVNCSNASVISVFGNASDAAVIALQQSQDNNNWYPTGESFVGNGASNFYINLGAAGAIYYRLLYEDATVVTITGATLAGK